MVAAQDTHPSSSPAAARTHGYSQSNPLVSAPAAPTGTGQEATT